jgi:hypothetical protein
MRIRRLSSPFGTNGSRSRRATKPRRIVPGPARLDDDLARREERTLTKALTFSAAGTKYCVKTSGPGTALRGAKVTLYHFVGGGMAVHYKDRVLPVTAYGSYPVPDPTEDDKTIDARMQTIVAAARIEGDRPRPPV